MPPLVSEFVLLYLIIGKVFETAGEVKPIAFPYSAEKLPHPATISHHYRPPITTDVPVTTETILRHRESPVENVENNTISIHRREHGIVPFNEHTSTTEVYYGDGALDFSRRYQVLTKAPAYENENGGEGYYYSTVRPRYAYSPTTLAYYDDQNSDINYDSKPTPVPADYGVDNPDYDVHPPDADYHYDFTTERREQSSIQESDHTPTTKEVGSAIENDSGAFDSTASHASPEIESGSTPDVLEHAIPSDSPVSPLHYHHYNSMIDLPSESLYTTPSNDPDAYNDFITATPPVRIPDNEVKISPMQDFPSPNRGYISESLQEGLHNLQQKSHLDAKNHVPNEVEEDARTVHFTNNKILQHPQQFAYSTHLENGSGITKGSGVNSSFPEYDEHDVGDHVDKKKEQYAHGGGQEHHSAKKLSGGDKGEKGYTSSHDHDEKNKGHRIKESHKGKYSDEKGKKGHKQEGGGHYGEQHSADKGEKSAKFGESGEHTKGHSTKGEHNIHKKNEYLKKIEFYDEHHEGGDHEKHGVFSMSSARKKGGKKRKGHHKSGSRKKQKGKDGKYEKGRNSSHKKGHSDAKGYDGRFGNYKKYGKKGGNERAKMWKYMSEHPKWDSVPIENEQ